MPRNQHDHCFECKTDKACGKEYQLQRHFFESSGGLVFSNASACFEWAKRVVDQLHGVSKKLEALLAEEGAMSIVYDVQDHDTDVAVGEHDAKKACALLLIAITTGPPATIRKKTGTLGLTVPILTKMDSGKPRRDGAPKVTKQWKCGKTNKTYDTKKECEQHCKSKPPKPPKHKPGSNAGQDFMGSEIRCQKYVTVSVKYTVNWDYNVDIHVYRLQFRPTLHNAAAKSKEAKEWNEKIVEHEGHHVSDAKDACNRILKDETQYTVSGSGDTEEEALDEVETQLLGKIAEDRLKMFVKCKEEIEKAAKEFHSVERSIPRPSFCG